MKERDKSTSAASSVYAVISKDSDSGAERSSPHEPLFEIKNLYGKSIRARKSTGKIFNF